jgi:hypothetical protein
MHLISKSQLKVVHFQKKMQIIQSIMLMNKDIGCVHIPKQSLDSTLN